MQKILLFFILFASMSLNAMTIDENKKACDSGNPIGCYSLGVMYMEGISVKQDNSKAFKWFKMASKKNLPEGLYMTGFFFEEGTEIAKDIKKALGYYARAADLGENRAIERIKKNPLLKRDLELRIKGINAAKEGDFESAIEYFQKSVPLREKSLGKVHPAVATTYNSIGKFYYEMGDTTKALIHGQKSLDIREKTLGKEHSDTALSYHNISLLYEVLGDYSKALKYAKKTLMIEEKNTTNDLRSIHNYGRIGWLYENVGDYPNALKYGQKALVIQENILGKDHNETSRSYTNLSFIFSKTENYPKALEYAQKALAIQEKTIDEDNPQTILRYDRISWLFQKAGDYPNALKYGQKVLDIQEKVLGKEHKDTARSYKNLSFIYQLTDNYHKALEYEQKALKINEKIFGEEHHRTIDSYEKTSSLYRQTGDFPMALKFAQKSLALNEKVFGKDHINTAANNRDLGSIYQSMQDYSKALLYTKKVLEIRKKNLGAEHKDIVLSYSNLSVIYFQLSQYSQALEYEQKALEINQKNFGKQHPNVADNYSQIGIIHLSLGDYSKALKYQQKALNIKKRAQGEEHEAIAGSYMGLGMIYQQLRDYSKALEYYKKALAINQKLFGNEDLSTVTSYVSLGSIYQFMGDYSKALEYNQKALRATRKVLGENNTATAVAYVQVALSYQTLGYYSEASEYYHKALDINERILGKSSTAVASSYAGLGLLYSDMGDYPQSLTYYQKALSITKVNFGRDHALTNSNYYLLGSAYQHIGDFSGARHHAQLAFDNFLINRDKTFTILDSKQKEKYLKSTSGFITLLLQSSYSYIEQLNKDNKIQTILQSSANAWLNYKGSIFDSENAIAMLYASTKDKKLKEKINNLVSRKRYLAKLYQSLPKPRETEIWKTKLKNTEKKIAKLTNEIDSKATRFKEQQGLKSISYKNIASHLKENELYIDYAKIGGYYYLFSLDNKEHIYFIKLDSDSRIDQIDKLIKAFRKDILTIRKETQITDEKLKSLTQSSKEKLSKLYELVIEKPLGDRLKNKTSLIISPDGALRLLPFETLYNQENDKYFIEEQEIRYIPSGKELVRLYKYSKDKVNKKQSAVIFADPNFNTNLKSQDRGSISVTPNTSHSGIVESLFTMKEFALLPGTRAEAKAIKSILGESSTTEYLQENATESNLIQVKEPNILHIATHGFFINDNTIPNPMLKSGIALTGANKSRIKGKGDGIVTALKLSGLDLKGTDLVVLSACQTGVVDINSTDSVSGLSKAFIQAGAKDIVMSLWSVDDQATKELMASFYQEMKANKNYAKALKTAKLKMIEEGRHPFYWGAFVVSGL